VRANKVREITGGQLVAQAKSLGICKVTSGIWV
jgi:hypothetical protein